MRDSRQFLILFACVCCLLVVATALPSADPRIDSSGGVGWNPVVDSDDSTTVESDTTDDEDDTDTGFTDSAEIDVSGELVPGNQVEIDVQQSPAFSMASGPLLVDGERIGEYGTSIDGGGASYTVPFTEEITVSAPDEELTETFAVETDADIAVAGPPIAGRESDLIATVGSQRLTGAAVRVAGQQVATTDENGTATVGIPGEADSVDISVERDPVAGGTTVETADIDVAFTSLLVLPGLPASVQVSADGTPVEGAIVEIDGETAQTDASGQARLRVPVSDAVTVDVTAGSERATETASGLYLRLTALVLVVPSIVIGVVAAYRRFISRQARRRHASVFLNLGSWLAGFTGLFSWPSFDGWRRRPGSLFPEWSFSLPSVPRLRPSLPSLPGPSLGGLFSAGDGETATSTTGDGRFGLGSDEADESDGAATDPGDRSPAQQVGLRWHRFVAHLGIERPETWTPGQVARRAIAAGYPGRQVRALVRTFRAIEYGGRDATPDRVERVREATHSLLETESGEDEP